MTVYFDTSVIAKLYYPEAESEALTAWVQAHRPVILYTPFHLSELTNAMALKVYRGDVRREQLSSWRVLIDSDVSSGVLTAATVDWTRVFASAGELSALHAVTHGTRTLDVLHVATALVLDPEAFVTHDQRQASLAAAVGLRARTLVELLGSQQTARTTPHNDQPAK